MTTNEIGSAAAARRADSQQVTAAATHAISDECRSTSDNPVRATALRLVERDWRMFPCRPGSKEPATQHGFQDSTTEPALIRWWWERMPTANLAVATGIPGPDVLDVDVKGTANGMVALERLRRAGLLAGALGTVRTPSGGPARLLPRYPPGQWVAAWPRHRLPRHGGYMLVPPSRVDGRRYRLRLEADGARRRRWAA